MWEVMGGTWTENQTSDLDRLSKAQILRQLAEHALLRQIKAAVYVL